MGAFATGLLLFGIAWVYGATESFTIDGIAAAVNTREGIEISTTGTGNKSIIAIEGLAPDEIKKILVGLRLEGLTLEDEGIDASLRRAESLQGGTTEVKSRVAEAAEAVRQSLAEMKTRVIHAVSIEIE